MQIIWSDEVCLGRPKEVGHIGKWRIFSISYNGIDRSKGDYILYCSLPGIKPKFYLNSIEHCKRFADGLFKSWYEDLRQERRVTT